VHANLQFEWAWQHPTESVAVRQAAAAFKSFSGFANKIKLAYTMLNLPSWQRYDLFLWK
jgi:structure-specific endonuclease subunit SLX1